ncbi:MAG TPA: hypothetical protein VHC70_10915 [Phycisphaerales bacterium]|nr:hypothetical protein [Phycisphaerales bacterium]
MTTSTSDNTDRASRLAQRLRQVQATHAGSPAETRKAMLEREIGASVGDLQGQGLRDMLNAALAQFQGGASGGASRPAAVEATPIDAANQIARDWASMPEAEREAVRGVLTAVLGPPKSPDRDAIVRDVCTVLRISPDQVQPPRVGELCAMLLRLTQYAETVWHAWGELSPEVMRSKEAPTIWDSAPGFLASTGPEGKDKAQLEMEARRLGKVVAALLIAVKPGITKFADGLTRELSPRHFREKAEGGMMTSKEVAAWKLFEKDMAGRSPELVADQAIAAIRELVHERIK